MATRPLGFALALATRRITIWINSPFWIHSRRVRCHRHLPGPRRGSTTAVPRPGNARPPGALIRPRYRAHRRRGGPRQLVLLGLLSLSPRGGPRIRIDSSFWTRSRRVRRHRHPRASAAAGRTTTVPRPGNARPPDSPRHLRALLPPPSSSRRE